MRWSGDVVVGPATLLLGALFFASANIAAKAVYWRGVSQLSLFLIRGLVVYTLNIGVEAVRNGGTSAARVALLRAGGGRVFRLCWFRSLAGFTGITLLNVAFQLMVLADAFALMLGVMTLATVLLARACMGGSERLSAGAFIGGILATIGLVLVTQPEALFGAAATLESSQVEAGPSGVASRLAGIACAVGSGLTMSGFNVLTRVLGRSGSGGGGSASPSMLLSFYMVTVGCLSGVLALLAAIYRGWAHLEPWPWMRLLWPTNGAAWAMVIAYCISILVGQLLLAVGYARLAAGRASILALTEIGFSWALDVGVLREPTNVAAALGTLTVFVGCALAATGAQKPAAARAAAESSSRVADRDSLAASGSAVFDPRDWIEVVAAQAHAAEPPASAAVKADEQST